MPYKKPNIEKVHYSIGEVAHMFGIAPSVLRYWEKEFKIIKPFKNAKGNRYYTPKDIDNIKLIYHLLKEKGLTIDGAKLYICNKSEAEIDKTTLILSKLKQIKDELLILKENLKEISTNFKSINNEQ